MTLEREVRFLNISPAVSSTWHLDFDATIHNDMQYECTVQVLQHVIQTERQHLATQQTSLSYVESHTTPSTKNCFNIQKFREARCSVFDVNLMNNLNNIEINNKILHY